jgi:hypothetical protein
VFVRLGVLRVRAIVRMRACCILRPIAHVVSGFSIVKSHALQRLELDLLAVV